MRSKITKKISEFLRGAFFERALLCWRKVLQEKAEEKYFSIAADEMNKDAKDWNAITTSALLRQS